MRIKSTAQLTDESVTNPRVEFDRFYQAEVFQMFSRKKIFSYFSPVYRFPGTAVNRH